VHPLARSPELPRPESPWPSRPDGLAGHTRVARVPVRGTRLPTPATEGPSGPRIPVRARADTDAGRVRMNAHARVLGLPRSDHLASIEPGRLQRRRRQRRVLPRDPEVNQHELASVRAGGSHVQLAVSLRTEMMRVCHATAAFGSRSLASGARWHSRPVGHRTRRAMEAPRALVRKRSSTWCACLGMRCRTLLIRSRGGGYPPSISEINQQSPAFQLALVACAKLRQGGSGPKPRLTEAQSTGMLLTRPTSARRHG